VACIAAITSVDLAFLHRGDQRVEGHILDFDLDAQLFADGADQIHVIADEVAVGVDRLVGRVVRGRADDDACPPP
jgi:hypothetical protein